MAGVALFTAIVVICVGMTFDPHLTYRGTGDAFFTLLALAAPLAARPAPRPAPAGPRPVPAGPRLVPTAPRTDRAAPRPAPAAPVGGRPSENHSTRAAGPVRRRTPPTPGATQHDPAIREVGQ